MARNPGGTVAGHRLLRLYQDRSGAAAYLLWPAGAKKLLNNASRAAGLADAVICRAYELLSYQLEPAGAVQLDCASTYGITPPIQTHSAIAAAPEAEDNRWAPDFRLRRIGAQVRMGLRMLRYAGAERREVRLVPEDFIAAQRYPPIVPPARAVASVQFAHPGEDRVLDLAAVPDGLQYRSRRLDRKERLQAPPQVAKRIVGPDGEAGHSFEERHKFILHTRNSGRIGRERRSVAQMTVAFLQLDRVREKRGHHRNGTDPGVAIMLRESIGGRDQPADIETFAEKGAFRIPVRSELRIGLGRSEFPAYQYDQPCMVPEKFGLPGKLAPQVLDVPIERLRAASRLQRRTFIEYTCLHGSKVCVSRSVLGCTRPAATMLVE